MSGSGDKPDPDIFIDICYPFLPDLFAYSLRKDFILRWFPVCQTY